MIEYLLSLVGVFAIGCLIMYLIKVGFDTVEKVADHEKRIKKVKRRLKKLEEDK